MNSTRHKVTRTPEEVRRDEQRREDIRRDFPECCAVVDEYRAIFGPDVKPTYMRENGKEIGKSTEDVQGCRVHLRMSEDKEEEKPKPKQRRVKHGWRPPK